MLLRTNRSVRWVVTRVAGVMALPVLTACGGLDSPPTTVALADSADQLIYGLQHFMTVDGVRRVRLEADSAYYYEVPQDIELRGVQVTFYDAMGAQTSTLTSREGTYNWRTGDMEAREDVVALTPDGRRLTTTILRYNRNTDEISGPEPYVYVSGSRRMEGEAFTSDPDFRNVVTTRPRGAVGRVQIEGQ